MSITERYLEVARKAFSPSEAANRSALSQHHEMLAMLSEFEDMGNDEFRVAVTKRLTPALCLSLIALEAATQ